MNWRFLASLLGLAVVALGGMVLAGWALDVAALKSVFPRMVTMKVNTALCLALGGGALALLARKEAGAKTRGCAAGLAAVMLALGALTLVEYFTTLNLHLDEAFVRDTAGKVATSHPGRMPPVSALSFVFMGGALLLAGRSATARWRPPVIAALVAAVAVIGVVALAGTLLKLTTLSTSALLLLPLGVFFSLTLLFLGVSLLNADVAARRQVEQTAERLAAIVESSADAIVGKDLESRVTSWNAGAERIFGYSASEMLGQSITRLIPPDRLDEEERILAQIRRGKRVEHFETTRRRKDGELVEVSVTVSPIRDASGAVIGASKVARDITARKRTEERSQWLASFPERNPNPVLELDLAEGAFHYLNAAATEQFPDLESLGLRHPLVAGLPELSARLAEEGTLRREITVGDRFHSQMLAYVKEFRRVRIYCADITERRAAELALRERDAQFHEADRRLAEIVHGMTEACFALDREWRFTFINDRGEALLKHRREEMLGRTMWEVFSKLIGTPMEKNYRRAMTERVPATFEAFSPIAERWLEIRLFPTSEGLAAFLLDIHARKQTEEALKQSEASFRMMADSMAQLAWIAEADGFIFWYNRRWYEYTGTTPEQMEGWGWKTVHDPEVLPKVMENWTVAIASGEPFEMEFPLRGADGKFRTFLTRGQPVKDAEGRVQQWFGTNTDVEILKLAEAVIRESEARLQAVTENLTEGLVVSNLDGKLIHWNRAALEMCGYTDRADGLRMFREFAETFELAAIDGKVLNVEQWPMSRVLQGEPLRDFEVRIRRRDQDWARVFSYSGTIVRDASGQPLAFLAMNDITARKRAEEALRASEEHFRFLDQLGEATRMLADPAQIMAEMARLLGEHLRVSRCAYADVEQDGDRFTILHDYTDGCVSTVGRYELALFGPRAVATLHRGETLIIRDVQAELSRGEGAEMFQAIGIQAIITCPLVKDGTLRAMMAVHQTEPRDWKPGEISMVQDVVERCWATIERRAAEEKVFQLNAELEQRVIERTTQLEAANKELEAFSYSVSHDLRAPLRAVDGFSQALIEDYGAQLPEEGKSYLRTIRGGAQRMGVLIDDLLTFSRLSRLPLIGQTVDVGRQVRETLQELADAQSGRQIELRIGELPPCEGDPALLKQVWLNLLSNALKYTQKRDQAVVEVGAKQKDIATVYFVRDNGTGFDMRYAHKLFGVFQRLHRQDEFEGTGVGLAIVQRIIHRHGGRIWVESAVDQGATFYFTLGGETKR